MAEELELRELLAIISKHKFLIMALFVCAIVGAFIASQLMTPIYQAGTTILVESGSALENPFAQMLNMDKPQLGDYAELLKSRSLLYAVASKLNLVQDENSPEMDELRKAVSIQTVTGANLIKISVESPDPKLARDLANSLAEEFIKRNESLNRTQARGAREFIAGQLEIVSAELAAAEEALKNYKQEHQVFAPQEEVKAILNQLTQLETLRAAAIVGQQEVAARLAEINKQLAGVDSRIIASTTITNNPLIQELKAKLTALEIELSGAREKYTDKHPTVLSLIAQIEEVKARMKREAERVVGTETEALNPVYQELYQQAGQLMVEALAMEVRLDTLAKLIAEQEQQFVQLPEKELQLANLVRNAKVSEQIYIMLRQKYEEVRITEAMESANVRVVDAALEPLEPIRPRKMLNVAIAAVLGLFVGVGLAFAIEFMDTTVKTAEEVEQLLELPVLGQIPSYLPEDLPKSQRYY